MIRVRGGRQFRLGDLLTWESAFPPCSPSVRFCHAELHERHSDKYREGERDKETEQESEHRLRRIDSLFAWL